jgi:alpha-beta hydrolase superfamily lysophospholipase
VFRFHAADGTVLDGAVLGTGHVGVVLANEYPADLCSWLPYGLTLASRGFRVLLFDFRGYGLSGSPRRRSSRGNVAADVVGAVAELHRRGARDVFLIGASLGGTAVLVAAPRLQPAAAGVVSLSGESDLSGFLSSRSRLNARAAMPRLRSPLLVMVTRRDRFVSVAEAKAMVAAAGARAKRLVIFPGSWHGWDLVYSAPFRQRASRLLLSFLRAHSSAR